MEISEKVKQTYRVVMDGSRSWPSWEPMCIALRDTLAEAMCWGFHFQHSDRDHKASRCDGCKKYRMWELKDWQQAAHARLLGEGQGDE